MSLALALACVPSVAFAEDPESEALITKGIELREQGKDDDALAMFKKALAKSPSPRARAQVALAEQALGLWVAAESDLVAALAAGGDPWITKNRSALEGALAVVRRHLGSLEVRGTPDGAEALLDGVVLGTIPTPAPFRVEAGRRTLELRAKGYHSTARTIEVPAGGVARETMALVALPPETAGPASAGRATGGAFTGTESDPGATQRILGWALVGAGGALAITGVVSVFVRKGIVDDYNVQCPGLGAAQTPACESKIDSQRTWMTVSVVSFVAGGVFVVGGLVVAATAPRRTVVAGREAPKAAKSALSLGCSPTGLSGGLGLGGGGAGAGMLCAGTF